MPTINSFEYWWWVLFFRSWTFRLCASKVYSFIPSLVKFQQLEAQRFQQFQQFSTIRIHFALGNCWVWRVFSTQYEWMAKCEWMAHHFFRHLKFPKLLLQHWLCVGLESQCRPVNESYSTIFNNFNNFERSGADSHLTKSTFWANGLTSVSNHAFCLSNSDKIACAGAKRRRSTPWVL